MTLEERFWAKVDRRGDDECWPWTGATTGAGYGAIRADGGRKAGLLLAHRVSASLAGAELGPETRHTCDNPPCVNPAHLRPGTHDDNMGDMARRGRSGRAKMTREIVLEVRRRAALGEVQRALADEFGVSQHAISKAVLRQSWTHV